jgi:hypothetical protein
MAAGECELEATALTGAALKKKAAERPLFSYQLKTQAAFFAASCRST